MFTQGLFANYKSHTTKPTLKHNFTFTYPEGDGIANKLRVFFDHIFHPFLLHILGLVFLHYKCDDCAATNRFTRVTLYSKRPSSTGLPDVLLIVIVLKYKANEYNYIDLSKLTSIDLTSDYM